MLVLFFNLGDARYALKCERVREICPLVEIERVPHASECFAGLIQYRGRVIPVVDMRLLVHREPCRIRFSTRIIVVDFSKEKNSSKLAGLVAEQVTEAKYKPDDAFSPTKVSIRKTPYLTSVLAEKSGMTYLINAELLRGCFDFLGDAWMA
jgi:chemotaxis-related protein WspB